MLAGLSGWHQRCTDSVVTVSTSSSYCSRTIPLDSACLGVGERIVNGNDLGAARGLLRCNCNGEEALDADATEQNTRRWGERECTWLEKRGRIKRIVLDSDQSMSAPRNARKYDVAVVRCKIVVIV